MRKISSKETGGIDSSTKSESILVNAPDRLCDHEIENSSSNHATSEEVAR